MKKIKSFSLILILFILTSPIVLNASNEAKFQIFYNNEIVEMEESLGKPFAEFGRTFVPIRFVGNVLNFNSEWDQETKIATISNGEKTIYLGINKTEAIVNGESVSLDSNKNIMTQIRNNRIYVPLRFVSENMGINIDYKFDGFSKSHNIYLYTDIFKKAGFNYDEAEFREEFLKLLNAERESLGLGHLVWDENLKTGTDIRAEELVKIGEIYHKRPNGDSWETAFGDVFVGAHGENLFMTMGYRFKSNQELAKFCFDKWKSSPGHYGNMIEEEFRSNWISVDFYGNSMVAVNIFNGR